MEQHEVVFHSVNRVLSSTSKSSNNVEIILGVVIGCVILLTIGIIIFCMLRNDEIPRSERKYFFVYENADSNTIVQQNDPNQLLKIASWTIDIQGTPHEEVGVELSPVLDLKHKQETDIYEEKSDEAPVIQELESDEENNLKQNSSHEQNNTRSHTSLTYNSSSESVGKKKSNFLQYNSSSESINDKKNTNSTPQNNTTSNISGSNINQPATAASTHFSSPNVSRSGSRNGSGITSNNQYSPPNTPPFSPHSQPTSQSYSQQTNGRSGAARSQSTSPYTSRYGHDSFTLEDGIAPAAIATGTMQRQSSAANIQIPTVVMTTENYYRIHSKESLN